MEEFSKLLYIPILDQVTFTGLENVPKPEVTTTTLHMKKSNIVSNWETRSGVKGFLAKFLIEKARLFLSAMNYHAFEEVLALLIYGLVLFPNLDQLIDVHAIKIFLTHNPIPTLLGDILHLLHTRTIKERGTLMCCIPLLSKWFTLHLPRSVLKNEQRMQWSRRIMSLSQSDIHWEFPNVPRLGIRGSITYNPSLALHQFGYARGDGPHDMIIQGIVFNYEDDPQGYRQRFIRAWNKVYKVDSKTLGRKNSILLGPYLGWMHARARDLIMPYHVVLPVIIEPEFEGDVPQVILHPDMPTNLEELQKSWIQLKEDRDTFETQFYANEKKVLEITKRLHEEQSINAYVGTKRRRPWET
ncbi:uncharacterized protein LOC131632081 [Vicia villosa]|uniref:uncharacterized protein LOC131632081 n=1 Tax=Vicia villosa TaxID=3911 RepID=UPI00273CF13E|nr:uncharacterized protein LOC131632081 [Vicia villosa]